MELIEGDFGSYINSSIRRDAASLYAKDKPTVKECITFRNFLMTEVAMCNSNRSGIWEFINVSHITDEKTKMVNGEKQLQMPDLKTNKTLHLTFPENIYNAMMRYVEVHRSIPLRGGQSKVLMLNDGEKMNSCMLSRASMILVNKSLEVSKHFTSAKICAA